MNVLVLGAGGREHALAWKIGQSTRVDRVLVAPGNPGMDCETKIKVVSLNPNDHQAVVSFCQTEGVDLVVVGPEAYLQAGIVDVLLANQINAYGPSKMASQLETSKEFAKEKMLKAKVPTANYFSFSALDTALSYCKQNFGSDGLVIKQDGLAAGKGVFVCRELGEAMEAIDYLKQINYRGRLIVEDLLVGREVSHFALCDHDSSVSLGMACDYKRLYDRDRGPNTGGMGAYSPVSWVTAALEKEIESTIVAPILEQMKKEGMSFRGTLFTGLMITDDGPKVLEFNVRFGDPETQALLPLLNEDLFEYLYAAARNELASLNNPPRKRKACCVHVVKAAKGYPGLFGEKVQKGGKIVEETTESSNGSEELVKVFYAGVAKKEQALVTSGGRVLGLTALAKDRSHARDLAYQSLGKVDFSGAQFRKDIGI